MTPSHQGRALAVIAGGSVRPLALGSAVVDELLHGAAGLPFIELGGGSQLGNPPPIQRRPGPGAPYRVRSSQPHCRRRNLH